MSELTTVAGYVDQGWLTPSAYLSLYYVSLCWVAVLVCLFAYTTRAFYVNDFPVLWPLRVLRGMGSLSASVLYIPLVYLLLSGFTCGTQEAEAAMWAAEGYVCYSGGHLVQAVVSVVLTVAFVVLAALFAGLVFDSNPLSLSLAAKAHGRADLVFIVLKTALIIVAEVFSRSIGQYVVVAVIGAGAVVWVATYAVMMPFTNHNANRLQLALACTFAWGAIALALATALPSYDASIMLYVGAPAAAAAGVFIADHNASRISLVPVASLRSSYEVRSVALRQQQQAVSDTPRTLAILTPVSSCQTLSPGRDMHNTAHAPFPICACLRWSSRHATCCTRPCGATSR